MKSMFAPAALALAAVIALAGTASAQTIRAGTLTCEGKGSIGLLIGSKEALACTYQPTDGGPSRAYAGTISSLGISIGVTGPSIIVWGVLASSTEVPSDMLTGEFVGVSADASLGLGAGAQVLVGGTAKSLVLQPLSVKGEVGVDIAAGVTGLVLKPL
jgi:hypothetical protein